tara:strand:- start:6 stop:413 length:408 start_codon:yes stop_codon:yes gene_type:complete
MKIIKNLKRKIIMVFFLAKLFVINIYFISIKKILNFEDIINIHKTNPKYINFASNINYKNLFFCQSLFLKYIPMNSCLLSVLSLKSFFLSFGIISTVKIGIYITNDIFKSHAWLELGEFKFLFDNNINYKEIYEF